MSEWYCVRSATRQEKRAQTSLREAGFAVYLPIVTRWERIGLRKLRDKREHALFPGYLFAQIGDGQFATAEAAEGVHAILRYTTTSNERSPRTVSPGLVEALQYAEQCGQFDKTRDPEADDRFKIGQRVRVLTGAWWSHIAVITKLDGKGRIEVLHSLFAREIPATYDPKQLEAVA